MLSNPPLQKLVIFRFLISLKCTYFQMSVLILTDLLHDRVEQ